MTTVSSYYPGHSISQNIGTGETKISTTLKHLSAATPDTPAGKTFFTIKPSKVL